MKASELIKELQKLIDKYGDKEVIYSEYNSFKVRYEDVIISDVFDVYGEKEMKFFIE